MPGRPSRTSLVAVLIAALALSGCASGTVPSAETGASGQDSCLTGELTYTYADAESGGHPTLPAPLVSWRLAGAESDGGDPEERSVGLTDADGAFTGCAPAETLHDATITFTAENDGLWRVVDAYGPDDTVFAFSTEPVDGAVGDVDLGAVSAPAETAGAFKIVDAVADLYDLRGVDSPCWTEHQEKIEDCHAVTFSWNSEVPEEDGGYWDADGSGNVVLAGADPASRHLVLHELGHWWQNELYDGWFPEVTGCDPHYVDAPSSTTCAWTEGFADAVAAWVLGDRQYVSSDGTINPFEDQDGTPWEGGDTTQGNIGATLLDLWRLDGPGASWDANVALFSSETSSDFTEYFTVDRPAAGLPTDGEAEDIIRRHGIDYSG
ncbi:hypothetical protein [Microbacterium sp. NPDC057944]|uniref:hypothetical protein n=1 Tax=Microbacterium sp. NPDC057944 TaxID=3346286 RepID=UPI0036DF07FD